MNFYSIAFALFFIHFWRETSQSGVILCRSNIDLIKEVLHDKLAQLYDILEQVTVTKDMDLINFLNERTIRSDRSSVSYRKCSDIYIASCAVDSLLNTNFISNSLRKALVTDTTEKCDQLHSRLILVMQTKASELLNLQERIDEEDFDDVKDDLEKTEYFEDEDDSERKKDKNSSSSDSEAEHVKQLAFAPKPQVDPGLISIRIFSEEEINSFQRR